MMKNDEAMKKMGAWKYDWKKKKKVKMIRRQWPNNETNYPIVLIMLKGQTWPDMKWMDNNILEMKWRKKEEKLIWRMKNDNERRS